MRMTARQIAQAASDKLPSDAPGAYYVSVVDGDRFNLLLGPFGNGTEALQKVEAVREKATTIDPRAAFYGFGVSRLPDDDSIPIRAGLLNQQFGLPS